MTTLTNETYNTLADEIASYKRDSVVSILKMGKVFHTAKKELEQGQFLNWLKDSRVNMSTRTAQRMMLAYDNFRHLIEPTIKESGILKTLDISHILELKHMPQRFKKSIEIEEDGKKQVLNVVDEVKTEEFLNKTISIGNKVKQVKDLPLKQFKEQIKEVGGEYRDLKQNVETCSEDTPSPISITLKSPILLEQVLNIITSANQLVKKMDAFDQTSLFEMSQDDKDELERELNNLKSISEAIIVKSNNIRDILA